MADTDIFRCYYDDGTIITSNECPSVSPNGSPLVNTEYEIIQTAIDSPSYAWLLIVLALVVIASDRNKR